MKTQTILLVVILVVVVAGVAVQTFAKKKVVLDNGMTGTASMFNKVDEVATEL